MSDINEVRERLHRLADFMSTGRMVICLTAPGDIRTMTAELARLQARVAELEAAPAIELSQLRDRIVAAISRITSGGAPMRIPAEDTDPDLVLGDVLALIDGSKTGAGCGACGDGCATRSSGCRVQDESPQCSSKAMEVQQ